MFRISCFSLLLLVAAHGGVPGKPYEDDTGHDADWEADEPQNYHFPEFEKIASFLLPLTAQVDNDECAKQLEIYLESLKNSSLWAVQMFDASAKIPQGLLTSDAYDLGNYDGCVDINLKRDESDNIFGRYCLATLTVVKKEDLCSSCRPDSGDFFMGLEMSTWTELMLPLLRYGFANNVFRSAICVPNKCTSRDVENICRFLYNTAWKTHNGEVLVSVPENACSTKESNKSTIVALIKQTITSLILCITACTIFDLLGWCSHSFIASIKIPEILSAYRNFKSLTSSTQPQHAPVTGSLKVYAIVFLVVIRRLSFLINGPIINRKTTDQIFSQSFKRNFFDVSNNIVSNTLLLVCGFSHFQKVYWYFRKNFKLTVGRVYLAEFLKTIPLYLLVISFYGYVFETVGDGPMWKERTEKSAENCKRNWAINLVHLNNFMSVDNMCIFESWYFAVIAQCFVLVPIVVRLMVKSSTTGLTTLGLLTGTALLLPNLVIYFNPNLFATSKNNGRDIQCHQRISTGTADRALSYFLGVCSSLIHTKIRDKKLSVSEVSVLESLELLTTLTQAKLFSLLAAAGIITTVCMPFIFNTAQATILQSLIINPLGQLLWGLSLSWIIIGVSIKKLHALLPVLRQRHLLPLSRLMHPYLLILGMVQLFTTGTVRTLDYFSLPRLVWMSTADLLAACIFAFIFYMAVKKPVGILINEKILGIKY